jgi:hypothetical protein
VRRAILAASLVVVSGMACTPHNVAEAEAKGDVDWLAKEGSPESVAALGRLADKSDRAVAELTTLAAEPESDAGRGPLDVYIAAWAATERKASWGPALLQRGLGDPASAPKAAAAMKHGALELDPLLPSLEGALRAGCGTPCAAAIASISTSDVAEVVKRRLDDAATRDAMCSGLASRDASAAAAGVYVHEPAEARDAQSCVEAAAPLASRDDAVLAWLGGAAEPALLGAASRGEPLPCARLSRAWDAAFHDRPRSIYEALAIPLEAAVKRCPKEMDGVLAAALLANGDKRTLAVSGLDPASATFGDLTATCAALPNVARNGSALTRSRAADALVKCPRR